MTSTNNMITHIAGMGRNGAHSILGANLRYLDSKYSLDCKTDCFKVTNDGTNERGN